MDRRSITNAGGGAAVSLSVLGTLGPALLRAIGKIEWAQGLAGVLTLFSDSRLSWPGIYLCVGFFAVATLITNNWTSLKRWRHKRAARRARRWDAKFEDAVEYIIHLSHFGEALPQSDNIQRLNAGADTLMDGAQKGLINIAGCSSDSLTLRQINRRVLKSLKHKWRLENGGTVSPQLIDRSGEIHFDKLFFDRSQLRSIWPEKPQRMF